MTVTEGVEEAMEVNQSAPSGIEDNLNLFSLPAEDVGVLDRKWIFKSPVNTSIDEDSVIEFNVEGNASKYIDLKNSQLIIQYKVVKPNGSVIPEDEEVAPVNLFLASMWRQVEVQLNHENVKGVNTNYPYKAMFDVLLNTSEGYKNNQLCTQMFYKDTPGFMDASSKGGGNVGFIERQNLTALSRECKLVGNLWLDVCQQDRLILNGVHVNIKLWPSSNEFKLMSSTLPKEHKIKITSAALKLCLVTVNPEIVVAHRDVMKSVPAVYPFLRSDFRTFSMAQSEMNLSIDNLFNGRVPHKLVVAAVSSSAFNGDYSLNPFNFKNYNLNHIDFRVDGQSCPIECGFKPNFDKEIWTDSFLSLSGDKMGDIMWNNGIELDDFGNGYAIYLFSVRSENELKKNGLTKLNITFKEALPEAITVLVYGQFPDLFEIDQFNKFIQS